MSKLFKEAIAEAKQLRELAEENAKNKIIESMTPRIRSLIEQELMDDMDVEEYEGEEGDGEISDEPLLDDIISADTDASPFMPPEDTASIDLDGLTSPEERPLVSINVTGTANVGVGAETGLETEGGELDEELVELTSESAAALAQILSTSSPGTSSFILERRIRNLQSRINKFDKLLGWGTLRGAGSPLRESARKHYIQLLKEMISLQRDVIFTEGATDKENNIRSRFNRLLKETRKMSRRHAETLFNRLFETYENDEAQEGDAEALDELDLVFNEDDLDLLGVEAPEDTDVSGLDVGVELAGEEEGGEEEDLEGDEEEIDLEELDLVFDEDDLDLLGVEAPEDADVTGLDVGVELAGEEGEEGGEEDLDGEEELEISESMLRRELRRMRRLREQDEAADADPFLDHGGEDLGDVIVDVSEDDLINALADELGDPAVPAPTVESRVRRRVAQRRRSRRISESRVRRAPRRRGTNKVNSNRGRRSRALTGKLFEYKKAVGSLRGQLNEMNLFNAKLLYVNKLMQNRNLSPKQQRAIVEALDNAKTLREAKLLYKSLTSSLNRRSTLREGAVRRTLGSSSRSTRSAQPSSSGVEVDRWAVLAGINKDN